MGVTQHVNSIASRISCTPVERCLFTCLHPPCPPEPPSPRLDLLADDETARWGDKGHESVFLRCIRTLPKGLEWNRRPRPLPLYSQRAETDTRPCISPLPRMVPHDLGMASCLPPPPPPLSFSAGWRGPNTSALFLTLFGLAFVTSWNLHVLALSGVAVALYASITW